MSVSNEGLFNMGLHADRSHRSVCVEINTRRSLGIRWAAQRMRRDVRRLSVHSHYRPEAVIRRKIEYGRQPEAVTGRRTADDCSWPVAAVAVQPMQRRMSTGALASNR